MALLYQRFSKLESIQRFEFTDKKKIFIVFNNSCQSEQNFLFAFGLLRFTG